MANTVAADQTLDEGLCTTEDVSQPLGPLRNQGNIGWCYANVAADLMTFRFQDQLNGDRASAGYIALTFNQFRLLRPNDDAGLVSVAMMFSQLNGLCPQGFQEQALARSPFKTIREQINALVELKETYDQRKKLGLSVDDFKLLDTYIKSESYINRLSDQELKTLLDKSSVRSFPRHLVSYMCAPYAIDLPKDIHKIRFQFGVIEGWKKIVPSFIKNRELTPSKKLGRQDLIKEIHNELNKKNMIAISYDTRIFLNEEQAKAKKPGLHASSIVGRRWENGKCELKLRNSWGANCAPYTNLNLKGKCDPQTGYVWIPDTLLMQTVSDVVYYRKD